MDAQANAEREAEEESEHSLGDDGYDEPEPNSAERPDSLIDVIRCLADTQRQMANAMSKDGGYSGKSVANVKLLPFDGSKAITNQQYQEWRKDVYIKKDLYNIKDQQLAQLIYSQVTGEAKMRLRLLTIEDLQRPNSLSVIGKIFDKARAKTEKERADKAYATWDTINR